MISEWCTHQVGLSLCSTAQNNALGLAGTFADSDNIRVTPPNVKQTLLQIYRTSGNLNCFQMEEQHSPGSIVLVLHSV